MICFGYNIVFEYWRLFDTSLSFCITDVFRYHLQGKKVEHVKRFIDAGFSFEHYYATAGHVYDRDTPPFDAICKRFVANGGIVDPEDAKLLEAASNKSPKKGKKRGPNKKKRKKKGDDMEEVEKEKLKPDGDTADAMGTGELNVDETSVVVKAEEATKEVVTAAEEVEAAPSVNEQDNSTMAQVMKLPL